MGKQSELFTRLEAVRSESGATISEFASALGLKESAYVQLRYTYHQSRHWCVTIQLMESIGGKKILKLLKG